MVQGMAEHKLHMYEKQAFFGTLRRLAGKHGRLPESIVITDKIDFSASTQPHTSGGFADNQVRAVQGMYRRGEDTEGCNDG